MADAAELWFESPPRPSCAPHGRAAESVCSRCGGFQCELCLTPAERALCHGCAVTLTSEAIPRLSVRAAWKLVVLPVVGLGCLLVLGARGASLHHLASEQLAFLGLWLLPLLCGLWLLRRPAPAAAFLGSLVALGLVAFALVPPLWADTSWQRAVDLALLVAAPLVAVHDAFAIDRAQRRRALLATMALA